RDFQRAYKACLSCRKRKSRCEISAEDYAAGKPCARCRRELKTCVFTEERPASKQDKASRPREPHGAHTPAPVSAQGSSLGPTEEEDAMLKQAASDRELPEPSSMLADSVVRTVVSSGNDALNLLFQAASQRQNGTSDAHLFPSHNGGMDANGTPAARMPSSSAYLARPPATSTDVINVWKSCRFVKMGWFSAEEALWFMEMFYVNLSPLSPVVTDFYRQPANHPQLLIQEPMLCCTILCLSSRYNVLPEPGGLSRSYLIHERLWDYCQHIILRVVLGQERGLRAKTRTLGTVEALLLLTEWHPRALHFPPPNDGWDSDLLLTTVDDDNQDLQGQDADGRGRWLEDVINPAKRSDRMAWMLLGCALSLGHELQVFGEGDAETRQTMLEQYEEQASEQRYRLRKLLYVYTEQLAARLGCKSIASHTLGHNVGPTSSPTNGMYRSSTAWQYFMSAWIELTRLVKSVSEMLFPSGSTKHLLQNNRYISLIEHFQPLLSAFKDRNLDCSQLGDDFYDILRIEYQAARLYTFSLGLQVAVERMLSESEMNTRGEGRSAAHIDPTDYSFVQEVIDASLEILQITIKLGEAGRILYSPVRIFYRIITASIFLLKGMSLGVGSAKLRTALHMMTRVIEVLRSGALDDMHLGSRYATLLEMHLTRLQKSFTASTRPPHVEVNQPQMMPQYHDTRGNASSNSRIPLPDINGSLDTEDLNPAAVIEDWWTLPLDSSLVPFAADDSNGLSWLGDGSLDFIWNL
ncbi:hypothetical protein NA57DRAFT_8111, partial [Rhizodiscina lignyota]